MEKKFDCMDIAKYLYDKVEYMDNLKLQKMMFFVYLEYYKKYNKELFEDEFEAWVYGPVLPELYYSFYELLLNNNNYQEIKDEKIKEVLDSVIEKYGNKNPFELVDISHDNPIWKNARKDLSKFEPSSRKLNIKKYLADHGTKEI